MNPQLLALLVPIITGLIQVIPQIVEALQDSNLEDKEALIQQIKDAQASVPVWE